MKTYLYSFAKRLRSEMTPAELLLWNFLRNKQMDGLRFRRQQPLDSYIVDFVCFEKKLIIEIDGSQHAEEKDERKDKQRDQYFISQGYTVLRFWNNEVLENLEGVWARIQECCE